MNKVSTKVMLIFNVMASALLTEEEKKLVTEKLANKINEQGQLQVVSQSERTQPGNKEKCIEKFYQWIEKALTVKPLRKKSKPSKASVQKRLDEKKRNSAVKKERKKLPDMD